MTSKEIIKYKNKSIPQLIKTATLHFNKFIRERDQAKPCVSCGGFKTLQAGHYLSGGHHSMFRFDERNVHGQCVRCNMFLHGNLINYRRGLLNRIGDTNIQLLEQNCKRPHKWDRFTLIDIILKYKSYNKD